MLVSFLMLHEYINITMSGTSWGKKVAENGLQFLLSSTRSPPMSEGEQGSKAVAWQVVWVIRPELCAPLQVQTTRKDGLTAQ